MAKPDALVMLVIHCDRCSDRLTAPGGLLFSPPDDEGKVTKLHLCAGCFRTIEQEINDA